MCVTNSSVINNFKNSLTIKTIMNFIKVSCLIAQAQCLTNWGD